MSTPEDVRVAVVTAVEAQKALWPESLVIEYDNRTLVNRATEVEPFLEVQINHIDGNQASLFPNVHRIYGHIILIARIREGQGTSEAYNLLSHFYPALHLTTTISPLHCAAAKLTRVKADRGWAGEAAVIPFWYDNQP